jgi:hypothetical protein
MILDPWGNPYNVAIDSNNDGIVNIFSSIVNSTQKVTNIFTDIAIWSNGPNSINEFGLNDDISNWIG